jgi:glycosyltransferase involved in cell wall biosynthesis
MRVTISVGGRFHAFDLAKQLQTRGFLHSLITSYPKWKAAEWSINPSRIKSIVSHEFLSRISRKLKRNDLQFQWNRRYDHIAANNITGELDIVVAWSGMALRSLVRAKSMGAKTVLERSSAHISHQHELLRQESDLTGVRADLPDPRAVAQELEEYDEADYICVPSNFAYRSFVDRGFPEHKLLVVSFGVDPGEFRPVPKRDSKFRVIHCGSLSLQKGIHYLLQAFHELRLKDAELWLIGRPSAEAIPYLRRYGGPDVVLKGTFPQSLLHEHYSQGSVLCAASVQDGFGMVVSQAMACALPVICTTNTGAQDLIRESVDGFTVPIRDVQALKERLSFLYSHRTEAVRMGDAARRSILEHFTWDHYGDRIADEYSGLLQDVRPHALTRMKPVPVESSSH